MAAENLLRVPVFGGYIERVGAGVHFVKRGPVTLERHQETAGSDNMADADDRGQPLLQPFFGQQGAGQGHVFPCMLCLLFRENHAVRDAALDEGLAQGVGFGQVAAGFDATRDDDQRKMTRVI